MYGEFLAPPVAGKYAVKARIEGKSKPVQRNSVDAINNEQGLVYRLMIQTLAGGSYSQDPDYFTPPSKAKWKTITTETFIREQNNLPQNFVIEIDEVITLKKGELCRVVLYASAQAQFDPNGTSGAIYQSDTDIIGSVPVIS